MQINIQGQLVLDKIIPILEVVEYTALESEIDPLEEQLEEFMVEEAL